MENKKCPYCGNALEEGTFCSRGWKYFLPSGEKEPRFYTNKAMNERKAISFPKDFFSLSIYSEEPCAYACRNCKFIMIPYE